MAVLQLENGTIYREIGAIANKLAALNVQIDRLPINKTTAVLELLVEAGLSRFFVRLKYNL